MFCAALSALPQSGHCSSLPIHCQFTANSLQIHCGFTVSTVGTAGTPAVCKHSANSLPGHCRFTADSLWALWALQVSANILLEVCDLSASPAALWALWGNPKFADVVCDCDPKFISHLWCTLHNLTGVHLKMSSTFHLETDGASEHTNPTICQVLHFHVAHNKQGWARSLPSSCVCFHMMNIVNASMGYSGFQLKMGHSLQLLPPLVADSFPQADLDTKHAILALKELELDLLKAHNNLQLLNNLHPKYP